MRYSLPLRVLALALLIPVLSAAALPAQEGKGKKYALLVGVTEYKGDKFNTLKYTENDVEKLAEILTKAGFEKVRVLTNARGKKKAGDAPTAANVKKAIDELIEDRGKRDTVLIALSGHGANVKVEDPEEKGKPKTYPFFCPYDASLLNVSYSTGRSKFLVNLNADLFDKLEQCGARSKLVLIDACRNEFKAESATRSLESTKVTIPEGVGVLFSCSKDEVAWESKKLEHGVFFHFVLEGLRGKAKNDDGEVTWKRLAAYVTEQVERQVGAIVGGGASQTPHELGNVRGTPILVPAGKLAAELRELELDREFEKSNIPFEIKSATRKGRSERVVLVELFTGSECPPCVAANIAFDAGLKAYRPADVVFLQYHLHVPGPDALTNKDTEARGKYYGDDVRGTPTFLLDGQPTGVSGGGKQYARDRFVSLCKLVDRNLESAAEGKINLAVNRKGDRIDLNADVSDLKSAGKTVRLRFALVEETVRYAGRNGQRLHHNVVRALPGGADGIALEEKKGGSHKASVDLAELREGLDKYLTGTKKRFSNPSRPMDLKKLKVIAFVQDDDSRKVFQAVQARVP